MIRIILPAYNEASALPLLLESFRKALRDPTNYRIIVVNDGSNDDTVEVIGRFSKILPIDLISHSRNEGLGRALRTGLKHAITHAHADDIIVTMDADNSHHPMLIDQLEAEILRGSDLVIASRYAAGGDEIGLSVYRSILSRGASRLLRIFFPIGALKDYTSGYRAYRASILKEGFRVFGNELIEDTGFTCMAELLIKLQTTTSRTAEVPLVLRYDLKAGKSKMKVSRTIFEYGKLISRLWNTMGRHWKW